MVKKTFPGPAEPALGKPEEFKNRLAAASPESRTGTWKLRLILRPGPELNVILFGIEEVDRFPRRPHHRLVDQNFDARFFKFIIRLVKVVRTDLER